MKIRIKNKRTFSIWIIFEILTLVSLFIIKDLSGRVNATNGTLDAYYWLSPVYSIIQTGSFIVTWGGYVACIFGSLISEKVLKLQQIPRIVKYIIIVNTIFLVISSVTTFIFEKVFIPSKVSPSYDIIYHSITMFIATLLYLCFWSCIGYGVSLIFKRNIFSVCICIFEQIFEHNFLFAHFPQLELFLPYALSRQLVIINFPFWDTTSWASVSNTVAYANMPMILDKELQPINVSILWIIAFLAVYLALANIKLVINLFNKKITMERELNDVI